MSILEMLRQTDNMLFPNQVIFQLLVNAIVIFKEFNNFYIQQ